MTRRQFLSPECMMHTDVSTIDRHQRDVSCKSGVMAGTLLADACMTAGDLVLAASKSGAWIAARWHTRSLLGAFRTSAISGPTDAHQGTDATPS